MTEMTKNPDPALTLAEVERIAASLRPLRGGYPTTPDEVRKTRAALDKIGAPADPQWIKDRAGTLLVNYYVAELPPQVVAVVAEDWLAELADYPQWAIAAACQWWMSRENKNRSKKPVPGDISAKAYEHCAPIRVGRVQIERFEKHGENPPRHLVG